MIKVEISELAYQKVKHWVHKSNKEVSGFGVTSSRRDGNDTVFTVHDAYLLEQEVGAAHTDIDAKALGKLMHKVLTDETYGRANAGRYRLNWWWHSHVNMEVFWSGTDKNTITDIGKNGLCLASVFNKRDEIRSAAAYTIEHPLVGSGVHFEDELNTVYLYTPDPRQAEWDKEFDECVKERDYRTSYQNYRDDDDKQLSLLNPWTDDDAREENIRWGLIGCGAKAESDYLKVPYYRYLNEMESKNLDLLETYEQRLYIGVETGELRY